jgi:hypothetical protein
MLAKAADPTAVAALRVAVAALAVAVASAAFTWWNARSAARAVDLERDRRHRDLTPRISLKQDGSLGGDDEGIWFTSDGPLDYDQVGFTFAPTTGRPPVDGLLVNDEWTTAGEIGPLALGERRFVRCRRAEDGEDAILHLRITFSNKQGTWPVPAQVEIPPIPAGPFVF